GVRLVTLVGPGGVGKTRLSQELADTLEGPVWFVDLAAASGVGAALEAALRTQDPVAALRGAAAAIVLDNCEHVVDEAARMAQRLLAEAPKLRIIATSREPLDIPGESLHPVSPLPEAAELFLDRAEAARPGLGVDPGQAALICRELDGIPLGIELAAARLRTMPVSTLVEQLGDRLAFRGGRTSDPRHRTLRAVIDWSWQLLTGAERELLSALTVFTGGATADAVLRVCGAPLDLLSSLVDKSLIAVSGDRYTMLETIRDFVPAAGAEIVAAHARYYTELAETAEPYLRTGEQVRWLAVLDAEVANLDAALRRGEDPLRLILPRMWPWVMRGRRREALERATEVLARIPECPGNLAHALCRVIVHGEVDATIMRSDHPAALNCFILANPTAPQGAEDPGQWAVTSLDDHPDPWTRAVGRLVAGIVRFEYGTVAGAEDLLVPALETFRRAGDRWGMSYALHWLSLAAENRRDFAAAITLAEECERLGAEISGLESPAGPILFLGRLAQLRARTGDLRGAGEAAERAWEVAERTRDPLGRARVLHVRGELARRAGEAAEAERCLREAFDLIGAEAPPQFRAYLHVELARVADTERHVRAALELMADCPDRTAHATVLEAVAELDPERAAELNAEAAALRGLTG
ncbi:MAG: hypothetical protein HOY71_23465, partial [Nonomuraea sp.]|nr:hypothetical protein [Nonomuraea sp.]